MKISLIRDWVNGDDIYRPTKYQILEVPDDVGEKLIADGIAEEHCATYITAAGLNTKSFSSRSEKDISDMLDAKLAAETGGRKNRPPFGSADVFAANGFGPQDPKKFWCGDIPSGSNFGNSTDFLKAVGGASRGAWDNRLSNKDITGSNQVEGGFLVPSQMAGFVYQSMLEDSPFMSKCTLLPMEHSSIKIPYVFDIDHSVGIHGTAVPHAVGEGVALMDISPQFGQCELNLHKVAGKCRVSNEQLEDSAFAMSTLLPKIFADKLGWEITRQIISGTGAGECLGILNSNALVTISAETDQDADTIVTENIVNIWARLLPAAQRKTVWLANLDTLPQLLTMTISIGTGGTYVWLLGGDRNNAGLANAAPVTILGRPVYFLEQMPTIGDAGDIVACNLEAYAIGKKSGSTLRIESSRDARFENDQTVYRAITRLDGQSLQSAEITPASGSANTLSNFVTLEARE